MRQEKHGFPGPAGEDGEFSFNRYRLSAEDDEEILGVDSTDDRPVMSVHFFPLTYTQNSSCGKLCYVCSSRIKTINEKKIKTMAF